MLKYFSDEREAKEQAKVEIKNILSNKMYINPDKFAQLLTDVRKKQLNLDSEISMAIKTQVDNIQSTKEIIEFSSSSVEKVKQEFKKLNSVWQEDINFHQEMELYDKVLTYRKNIKISLDQMNDFMNMSTQIRELEDIYKEPLYFEFIQGQLLWLKELRDSLASKLDTDSSIKSSTMKQILQQFTVLDEFEQKFYGNIYETIFNCLEVAKQKPKALIKTIKTLDQADKHLATQQKEPYYIPKVIETMKTSIDRRFKEKFPNPQEIGEVMENMDFTVNDLIIVIENLAPCFPQEMDIFKLYESRYKKNVESLLMPFLSDRRKITESPGILIVLASWVDNYENLLKKAGVDEMDYFELKMKIKEFLPEFIMYLEDYLNQGIKNIMDQDRPNHDVDQLNELDQKNEMNSQDNEVSSNFAQDLFRFVHGQLEVIGDKIKGETFMEVIRVWTTNLAEFQSREKNKLILSVSPDERLRIVLYINNYYKCLQNIAKTEELTLGYAAPELHERVESVIADLKRAFSESILDLLQALVESSFVEIESGAVNFFFKLKWTEEDLMGAALATMEDYFSSFKRWLISPLHYSRGVRLAFEHLLEIYIERFLYAIKKNFNTLKEFNPKKLKVILKEKKKESKKKSLLIFSNTDNLMAGMQKDADQIVEFAKNNHGTVVNESYFEKVQSNFGCIFTLLKLQKFDFEGQLHKVYENFKELGIFVLEAVLTIREDCDSSFKKNIIEIYNNYIVKKN